MSDRIIVYQGAIPQDLDILNTNKNTMISLGMLAKAILGNGTLVDGLECTPTSPASLNVLLASGSIMSNQNVDGTAYGSIAADTTNQIVKQGIRLSKDNVPATGTFAVPSTTGQSVNYLIQVEYQDVDGGSTVLPYYNASNPAVAFNGPANAGTSQNTVRQGSLVVNVKAGTAATTGSQVTPTPDAGFTGLWVVTIANGATTIVSGNITPYTTGDSNPIISEKLKDKISLATGDARYAFASGGGTRTPLANATNFYVNGSTGNDSNAGTVGSPWLTLQHAMNTLLMNYDFRGFTATINVADGTYTTAVSTNLPILSGPLTINGNSGTPSNVLISTSADCFYLYGNSPFQVTIQNMKLASSGNYAVYGDIGSNIALNNVVFGNCGVGWIFTAGYLVLLGGITLAGNTGVGVNTSFGGTFHANAQAVTTSGTPILSSRFSLATNRSYQNWLSATFPGTGATGPRYSAIQNSVIDTGTANSNFLPGNAADPTPTASGGLFL
jgi:hypothetical protein